MNVKALLPFAWRDAESGDIISVGCGEVLSVSSELGETLISDGLAEAYTLITPTGTKSITENAEGIDVTQYASADVNVPNPSTGSLSITENGTYDVSTKAEAVVDVVDESFQKLVDGSIVSAVIPNGVTEIRSNAFASCNKLTNVVIPNSVTQIGLGAFTLTKLTEVDIPSSVTLIDQTAFQNISTLVSVTVRATAPPTAYGNSFGGASSSLKIYVPSESVETYKSASGWSTYASKIEAIPTT